MAYTKGSKGADTSTTRRSSDKKKVTDMTPRDKKNSAMETRANQSKPRKVYSTSMTVNKKPVTGQGVGSTGSGSKSMSQNKTATPKNGTRYVYKAEQKAYKK